ncbi:MAG: DUF1489 family protein [Hyphomicrobium sp.]
MALHLIKLSVGSQSVADLVQWQRNNCLWSIKNTKKSYFYHTTFHEPKRIDELLEGGSLYWVIKNCILARQKIVGFDKGHKENGTPCCLIILDQKIHLVKPVYHKSFQGWRYLKSEMAPPDLSHTGKDGLSNFPENLRRALVELCLL